MISDPLWTDDEFPFCVNTTIIEIRGLRCFWFFNASFTIRYKLVLAQIN